MILSDCVRWLRHFFPGSENGWGMAGILAGWSRTRELLWAEGGMWLMDFPPHWHDPQPLRAYLLNFYVVPEARGQGLAYRLLKAAVEEARGRGIKVVSLHASAAGRPIYEKFGFGGTSEMMLKF